MPTSFLRTIPQSVALPILYASRHTRVSPGLYYVYRPKYTQTPGVMCQLAYQGHALAHAAYIGQSMCIVQVLCTSWHTRVSPGHCACMGQSICIVQALYAGRHTRVSPRLYYLYRSMSIYPPVSYASWHNRVSLGHTTYICLCLYTLLYNMLAGTLGLAQAILPIYAYVYIPSCIIYRLVYQGQPRLYYLYIPIYTNRPPIITMSIYRPSIMHRLAYDNRGPGYAASICLYIYTLLHYTLASIPSSIQVTPPLDANVFVSQYMPASTLYQEISRQYHVYILVFASSQHYMLAGILDQEISRARCLYIPKYTYPPSMIRWPAYYIKRHLGNTTCICQCLRALLALYASQHTTLGDVQGAPPIYANVFISWHYTLASTLYQGKSRVYYLYMPISLYPGIVRQPAHYTRRRLGHTTCIYQCLYILVLYASRHTISKDVQAMLRVYTNVFIPSWRYMPAGIAYQEISRKCCLYIPKYMSSQHYMPASILYQGTSSVHYLYILMSSHPSIICQLAYYTRGHPVYTACIYQSISQHYANISSGNYTLAARLYLGIPRLYCL